MANIQLNEKIMTLSIPWVKYDGIWNILVNNLSFLMKYNTVNNEVIS
jgi:hypothetical protein